jgi:hypothetical protein
VKLFKLSGWFSLMVEIPFIVSKDSCSKDISNFSWSDSG